MSFILSPQRLQATRAPGAYVVGSPDPVQEPEVAVSLPDEQWDVLRAMPDAEREHTLQLLATDLASRRSTHPHHRGAMYVQLYTDARAQLWCPRRMPEGWDQEPEPEPELYANRKSVLDAKAFQDLARNGMRELKGWELSKVPEPVVAAGSTQPLSAKQLQERAKAQYLGEKRLLATVLRRDLAYGALLQ